MDPVFFTYYYASTGRRIGLLDNSMLMEINEAVNANVLIACLHVCCSL